MKSFSGKVYFLDSIALECKLTPFLLFKIFANSPGLLHSPFKDERRSKRMSWRLITVNIIWNSWKLPLFSGWFRMIIVMRRRLPGKWQFSIVFPQLSPRFFAGLHWTEHYQRIHRFNSNFYTPFHLSLFHHSLSFNRGEERNPSQKMLYSASIEEVVYGGHN